MSLGTIARVGEEFAWKTYAVQPAAQHPKHPDGKECRFDTLTLIPFERKLVCEAL